MRRFLVAILAVACFVVPAQAQTQTQTQTAPPLSANPQAALDALILGAPPPPPPPDPAAGAASPDEGTILGMSYPQAALAGAGVVAAAALINWTIGGNLGTILGALYVGHLVVEAALVAGGAGASWGLGWWDGETAAPPPTEQRF